MAKVGIFFADGCEEIEGLAVVDICRRAGLEIETISIMGRDIVAGSHRIKFQTDAVFEDVDFDTLDGVILPGGMPGTLQLGDHERVNGIIREFAEQKKLVAAICAAPSVLGAAGILEGKTAVCHPGFMKMWQWMKISLPAAAWERHLTSDLPLSATSWMTKLLQMSEHI